MTIDELGKVLLLIRPGEQWSIDGDNKLTWLSQTPIPTDTEIANGKANLDKLAYRDQRAKEYPPIGDQLDALFTGGQALTDMQTTIQAVKTKYPKP